MTGCVPSLPKQAATEHQPLKNFGGKHDTLTAETPLLHRRSGVKRHSANNISYGADMEKRDLISGAESSCADSKTPQRSSRSTLKWAAGLALFSISTIGIYHNAQTMHHVRNTVADLSKVVHTTYTAQKTSVHEARQDSGNQPCSATSNCTRDLIPFKYKPLPLGSIKPLGWLHDQMQGLADGLAGHEREFYYVVQDSPWTTGNGGKDYSDLNEGLPYWFNGLVPLAYQLGDERLQGQVRAALDQVLHLQNGTTGWLGPFAPGLTYARATDAWGRFPFMLGMIQMAEADSSYTTKIVDSLYHFIPYLYELLAKPDDPNEVWGRARYQDAIVTMQWLYENHPDWNGASQKPLLSNMMYQLKDFGVDWTGYFQKQSFLFQDIDTIQPAIEDDHKNGPFHFLHAVNAGQGLKTPSVDYRFTHNDSLLEVQHNAINWTLEYHGTSSGTIVGDERESNQSPNRGSELCTAVESMFSMAYAYGVTGENNFADKAERLAFNALPVMMTPDNWAHQYMAQPNQPWAAPMHGSEVFWNVGDQGITFGLEPNYPCCAVNHPQGYPKFVSHSFMSVGDDGLAHVLLSPVNATTKLGNGAVVNIAAITDYPFSDILTYQINADNPFTFYVRVPDWAKPNGVSIKVDDGELGTASPNSDSLVAVSIPAGKSTIQYVLKSALRVESRANETVAVFHGALLYALDVGYHTTFPNAARSTQPAQARTWNISNTMAWSYAIDPTSLKYFQSNSSTDGEGVDSSNVSGYNDETTDSSSSPALPNPIWDYQAPAQFVKAVGCPIEWPLKGNTPDIPPAVDDRKCTSNSTVELNLRPYGSLKVHMAELPAKALVTSNSPTR